MLGRGETRLLVIGLDGGTFDVLRPMAARGDLPCIGAMMKSGGAAVLHSTVPAITPPAWASFATGAPPDAHGVFGFSYPAAQDHSLRLTTAADLQRPTLWRQLSGEGLRILMLDAPFTFPPEPVNGCMVAGFPLPATGAFTHPPDLADRLESSGIACARHPNESPDPATPAFLPWLDRFLGERLRIFRELAAREPWQFAMVGTMALDWAQHALWKYFDPRFVFASEPEAPRHRETLFATYRRVDGFVADLIEVAGDETAILIVSDHGFGTAFHYDWVSEALAQAGLLFWRGGSRGIAAGIGNAALRAARSSPRLQRLGKRWLGDAKAARTWARRARSFDRIDWRRTRVFPAGDYHLNLYVNSRSRFSRGVVEAGADYARVLDDAVAALESFRPPGHTERLVARIVRYEGGAKSLPTRVPDLSLELTVLPPCDETPGAPTAGLCGFHSPKGVLISPVPELFGAVRPHEVAIAELAPAILRYFGVRADEAESSKPAEAPQAFSTEQTAAVLDSLRHLGYLD